MRQGKELERLVDTLERAILVNQTARIVAPYKPLDRTTGKIREHDVAIILSAEHHELITAIECRDRSRPVGVPQVEAFHQKCQDTGINRGIIVSSKGFCSSAVTKAAHLGITCLRLDEVQHFDWIGLGSITHLKISYLEKNCIFIPETNFDLKPVSFRLVDESGRLIETSTLDQLVRQEANNIISGANLPEGEDTLDFQLQIAGATIESDSSTEKRPLKQINVRVRVRIEPSKIPIKLLSYRQEGESAAIREAGVASFDFAPTNGDLVFLKNADGSTDVKFVIKPDTTADPGDHIFRLEDGRK